MQIDAVVPAYNEASTIGPVVAALRRSPSVARVIVMDDGSRDGTGRAASEAGATVIRLDPNGGKGKAMLAGARVASTEYIGFFDADLRGLTPGHVDLLVAATAQGYDMVCGLRDYGVVGNPWQLTGPVMTGERIVNRQLLGRVPESCWSGYAIETAMNDAARRAGARTVCIMLPGVTPKNKVLKGGGFWNGLWAHTKMVCQMINTSRRLRESCGGSCAP